MDAKFTRKTSMRVPPSFFKHYRRSVVNRKLSLGIFCFISYLLFFIITAAPVYAMGSIGNIPPAAADQSVITTENTSVGISLTASDENGDTLVYSITTDPEHGSLSGNIPDLLYTPNLDYTGSDSFSFKANDEVVDSNIATVTITVNASNDPPVAAADAYSTDEDVPLNVAAPGVLANDSDVDGDALSALTPVGPSNGALLLNADGSFTYTPDSNFNGADSFTYTVSDGSGGSDTATVTITVNSGSISNIGFGIMGDSNSDEYRADDNRGGSYADTTLNWVEQLVLGRGINFGPWGTRSEPRRTGYEYNWARSGTTAHGVISSGQLAGLAGQIASGKVLYVFMEIGGNDFNLNNGTYAEIYNGSLSGPELLSKINNIISDITTAVDTVLNAGAEGMVLVSVPNVGVGTQAQEMYPVPEYRQRVTDVINSINANLESMAAARGIAFYSSNEFGESLFSQVDANGNLNIGGELITAWIKSNEPHHLQLDDATGHAGTVLSGLLANAWFIEPFNNKYGMNIAPFNDNEILELAGIGINSNDLTPPSPDPMEWSTPPYATGSSSISMTAQTASDQNGVEYYFEETSGNSGGSNSGPQNSASFTDTGLSADTLYTYRVYARDKSSNQNQTGWSYKSSATTDAETPPPISGCSADPMSRESIRTNLPASNSVGNALLPLLPSMIVLGLWSLYRRHIRRKDQIMSGSKDSQTP